MQCELMCEGCSWECKRQITVDRNEHTPETGVVCSGHYHLLPLPNAELQWTVPLPMESTVVHDDGHVQGVFERWCNFFS